MTSKRHSGRLVARGSAGGRSDFLVRKELESTARWILECAVAQKPTWMSVSEWRAVVREVRKGLEALL